MIFVVESISTCITILAPRTRTNDDPFSLLAWTCRLHQRDTQTMHPETKLQLDSFRYQKTKNSTISSQKRDTSECLVPSVGDESWEPHETLSCLALLPFLEPFSLLDSLQDAARVQTDRGSTMRYFSLVVEYDPIQISCVLECELYDMNVHSLWVDAYQWWLETTLGTTVNLETIFLYLVPKDVCLVSRSILEGQVQGMVIQVSLPTFVQQTYCYRCQEATCRNPNTVLIRCRGGRFELYHRDSTGSLLHQTGRCTIRKLDLMCQHCSSFMKECVEDGFQEVHQRFRLVLLHDTGLFGKGILG
jgi:hypothetical protein